jgi:cysteine-rich repeat protein
MKKRDVWQRLESILKMPTALVTIFAAGLVSLACSNSGLKSRAGDAATASGGQAASTISSGSNGGSPIGLGGAGGVSIDGTGGTIGSGGISAIDAGVQAGDSAAAMRPCGNGVLERNQGENCDDGNANNGDGCGALCQIEAGWQCPTQGQACIHFCGTDMMNACDAGSRRYCGDGIVDTELAEQCDIAALNGVCLDENWRSALDAGQGSAEDAGCPLAYWHYPDGTQGCDCPDGSMVYCTAGCMIPYSLQ